MLAAVVAMPLLLRQMGAERIGLLSLVWVLIGYFGLFDLGIGRALTKLVAEHRDSDPVALRHLVSTGLWFATGVGLCGAVLIAATSFLADDWIAKQPTHLQLEITHSLLWVAAAIPFVVLTAVVRGALEGMQRFRLLAAIRAPSGAALFLAPCLATWYVPTLDAAVASMVLVRILTLIAHIPPMATLVHRSPIQMPWLRRLIGFGGWLTISGVVGPILVYLDRFVLSQHVDLSTLPYYTVPFEAVSRLVVIPSAINAALLPLLSRLRGAEGQQAASTVGSQAGYMMFAVVLPVVILGAWTAPWWLTWWMGADFAIQATTPTRWLLIGFGLNAMANVPIIELFSRGMTKIVALFHLSQLPVLALIMPWVVINYGVNGIAILWCIRSAIDWMGLFIISKKMFPHHKNNF